VICQGKYNFLPVTDGLPGLALTLAQLANVMAIRSERESLFTIGLINIHAIEEQHVKEVSVCKYLRYRCAFIHIHTLCALLNSKP
jgi:hypothetical protein